MIIKQNYEDADNEVDMLIVEEQTIIEQKEVTILLHKTKCTDMTIQNNERRSVCAECFYTLIGV